MLTCSDIGHDERGDVLLHKGCPLRSTGGFALRHGQTLVDLDQGGRPHQPSRHQRLGSLRQRPAARHDAAAAVA